MAKKALQALQKHARVECGFAGVNDVRTGKHEDRMDSFVLSETIKYLFLIFADPSELILDLDNFIFTTEAHLLPLSLGQLTNVTGMLNSSIHSEFICLLFRPFLSLFIYKYNPSVCDIQILCLILYYHYNILFYMLAIV